MKKDLRILIAYSTRYPKVRGGVDTMIVTLVDQLKQRYRVTLFAAGTPEESELTSSTEDGVKTFVMHLRLPYRGSFRLRSFCAWLLEFPRTVIRLRRLLRDGAIDVIHLHMLNQYYLAFLVIRLLGGPPYLITLHGSDVERFKMQSIISRSIARGLLHRAAAVVAVSNALAHRASEVFPHIRSITSITNGIPPTPCQLLSRSTVEEALGMALPAQYFTAIGALTAVKGHDIAIEAWAIVNLSQPDVHLFIVGDGPLMSSYRNKIRSLGLEGRVHLVGALPRETALTIAREGIGLVVPSRSEGIGYALLEAGALGLPAICSQIPAFMEVVENGASALVFPTEDHVRLANAVCKLASNGALQKKLGQDLHHRIDSAYSAERMTNAYIEIYRKAISSV